MNRFWLFRARQMMLACTLLSMPFMHGCSVGNRQIGPEASGPAFGGRIVNADRESQNWLSTGRDYREQRFSPLDKIHKGNISDLGLTWYYEFDTDRGQQATPLVIDGVLYTSTAWSKVFAFNAKTGDLLWKYDPRVPPESADRYCCDVINRGVAAWGSSIFVGTLDGRLISLNARTGKEQWSVMTVKPGSNSAITGAPRVVKGMVIIGSSGADFGERGHVTAYDAESGKQIWRFYTVPGNPAKPFENPALARAAATWTGSWWENGGGGTVWDSIVYDPEIDLLYIGVGNGYPHSHAKRSPGGGDNLFLSSIVALRPDSGEYVWHYQTTPADNWDYTATQPMILADLRLDGHMRKVIMQAPKNGFFYVIDRISGELLSARNYVETRWASHIDMASGRPVENTFYRENPLLNMPSFFGGHNWHPMAYSPQTGFAYFPWHEVQYPSLEGLVAEGRGTEVQGTTRVAAKQQQTTQELPSAGGLLAWDVATGKPAWRIKHQWAINGGVLATAGGLVFEGTADGYFLAFDATTGDQLWQWHAVNGIMAGPISYAVDDEQYIAVMAGYGGGAGMAYGYASPDRPRLPGRLYVFKLDGKARAVPQTWLKNIPLALDGIKTSADTAQGDALYSTYCMRCHGIRADAGILPDLRYSPFILDASAFRSVVREGILARNGMVSFVRLIDDAQVEAIRAYLISAAKQVKNRPQNP